MTKNVIAFVLAPIAIILIGIVFICFAPIFGIKEIVQDYVRNR